MKKKATHILINSSDSLSEAEQSIASMLLRQHQDINGLHERVSTLINAKPTNEHFQQASQILATWGVSDHSDPLDKQMKDALLSKMRFGKGARHVAYGDNRWAANLREESLLYDYGVELTIPCRVKQTLQFMCDSGLSFSLHRKPVTYGCKEAILSRINSETGAIGVALNSEIKTLLFKALDTLTNKITYIASHTRGTKYTIMAALKHLFDMNNMNHLALFDASYCMNSAASELGLSSGRLNPVSINFAALETGLPVLHVIDSTLIMPSIQRGYTNAGQNTWGIEIFNVAAYIRRIQQLAPPIQNNRAMNVSSVLIAHNCFKYEY